MPQGCELMAVVKTEAYGHGAYEISTRLEKDGVKAFAVATIDEGIRLRCYGIRGDILILGFSDVHRARELKKYRLTQTLIDAAYAECLNQQGTPVRVHIGIDSGMHRLGFDADDFENIRQVFRMKNLKVDGMFTHLCCCESLEPEDVAFTKNQICRFYALIDYLKEHKVPIPKLHIQSSYGLLNYPELKCDYVREGISLYGVASTPQDKTTLQLDLRPVLALKAKVILIRDVPQGDFVGYDRAYQTERDSKIAILPIGYGDGFPRNLSCGKASVKIGTYIVPIIGRICMDQLAIDITDTEGVAVGDTATLIDNQENSLLSTPCVAERSDSISNEILSRMGARLPIVIKE
jgi:serine/alanine racemase